MGVTNEHLPIVRLDERDVLAGLALSAEARWNQNEADWQFFLTRGVVFGVRDNDGPLIATAALLPYTEHEAWISMVLVTESRRRHGIATRLLDACLEAASRRGLTSWLDATPAGAMVYGPLGFTPTIELRRLRLERAASPTPRSALVEGKHGDFISCDSNAMGFDRRDFLTEVAGRPGSRLLSTGHAMTLVRDGRSARHIGPVFADDADRALALIAAIVASEGEAHLIDTVAVHADFTDGLIQAGWTIERPFQRMRFGNAPPATVENPFAVAGPEFG
jgi:GNAT superfamily N-acetyltransferase